MLTEEMIKMIKRNQGNNKKARSSSKEKTEAEVEAVEAKTEEKTMTTLKDMAITGETEQKDSRNSSISVIQTRITESTISMTTSSYLM